MLVFDSNRGLDIPRSRIIFPRTLGILRIEQPGCRIHHPVLILERLRRRVPAAGRHVVGIDSGVDQKRQRDEHHGEDDPHEEDHLAAVAFAGAPDSGTYATGPQNGFGTDLNGTLSSRQIAFNVVVRYPDGDVTDTEPMVQMGEPSDNAVSATRTVGLYNGSQLSADGDDRSLGELADGEFYAPDTDSGSQLYAVVEVEVIAWRK